MRRSAYRSLPMLLLGAFVAASFGATGCGLKRRHRCTASAPYAGKTRTGKGDDFDSEEAAKAHAAKDICKEYCTSDDSDVEAAFQKAKGSKSVDRVERLQIVNNEPVLTVLNQCIAKCDAGIATTAIHQECTYSGI